MTTIDNALAICAESNACMHTNIKEQLREREMYDIRGKKVQWNLNQWSPR